MVKEEKLDFQKELIRVIGNIQNQHKEIECLREHIKKFHEVIKNVHEDTGFDYRQIIKILHDNLFFEFNKYNNTMNTEIIQKELFAINVIDANPYLIQNVYNEVKDKKIDECKEAYKLNCNEKKCIEFEIKKAINNIKKLEREYVDEDVLRKANSFIKLRDSKNKDFILKALKTIDSIETYDEFIKICERGEIFIQKTEEDKIKKYISCRKKYVQEKFINDLKEKMKMAGSFLKQYDILEELLNSQNEDYVNLGMPDMQYNMKKQDDKDIGLEDIFSDEYLNSLNITQLSILNAFWQNKYTKMLNDVKDALFVIETINLADKMEDDSYNIELTDEELLNIIYKINLCDNISKKFDNNIAIREETKDFQKKYKKYFDSIIPNSENSFIEDYSHGHIQRNAIKMIYKTKLDMLNNLLLTIEHDRNVTNWGYIKDVNGKDDIKREKFILIGIDYPGFNVPLKIHMRREELVNYLKLIREDKSTVIPVYGGDSCLMYKGKMLTSKILMPLTEKMQGEIIDKNKKININDIRYSIIRQLGNLVTKKVKRIDKICPNQYIDIETGEIGKKVDGKIVPSEEDVR